MKRSGLDQKSKLQAPRNENLRSILAMSDDDPKAIYLEAIRLGFVVFGAPIPAGSHIQYGPVFASGLRVVNFIRVIGEAIREIIGGRLRNQEKTEQQTFYEVMARLIKDAIAMGGNAIYGFKLEVNKERRESYVSASGHVVRVKNREHNYSMNKFKALKKSLTGELDMYGMQTNSKSPKKVLKNGSSAQAPPVNLLISGLAMAA